MAVCKKCGCAIPLGQKGCDICDRNGISSPASTSQWTPPPQAAIDWPAPSPQSPAPSTSSAPLTSMPTLPIIPTGVHRDLGKWQAAHRWAWRYLASLGVIYVGLGLLTALGYVEDIRSLFGWTAVVVGLSFGWFAFTVRQGSLLGMSMAMIVYTAYTIAFLNAGSFVIFRFFILVGLGRAWLSIYALSQQQKSQAAAQPVNQSRAA